MLFVFSVTSQYGLCNRGRSTIGRFAIRSNLNTLITLHTAPGSLFSHFNRLQCSARQSSTAQPLPAFLFSPCWQPPYMAQRRILQRFCTPRAMLPTLPLVKYRSAIRHRRHLLLTLYLRLIASWPCTRPSYFLKRTCRPIGTP